MENDLSKQLYDKYFNLNNPNVTVFLKNGKTISGIFISFCRGEYWTGEEYIIQWRIVSKKEKTALAMDAFGFLIGELIHHSEIKMVQFEEDNSKIEFINY